jgi:hypothetical protein
MSPTGLDPRVYPRTVLYKPGTDPGFEVRGGGAHLKNIFGLFRVKNHDFTPKKNISSNCGGMREHFWGISCEKSRFYAKKIIFFPIAKGSANIFEVCRVKNHEFTQKNHIFSNFRGAGAPGAPWIRPCKPSLYQQS